jgi:hypothetical protein
MPPRNPPAPPTPYDRRMQATADKLGAALDRLARGEPKRLASTRPGHRLTVAALAREAGVARNAIYTNHRDILDDLARARKRGAIPNRLGSTEQKVAEQRVAIDDMQLQIRQLVTENAGYCDARSRQNAWPKWPIAATPSLRGRSMFFAVLRCCGPPTLDPGSQYDGRRNANCKLAQGVVERLNTNRLEDRAKTRHGLEMGSLGSKFCDRRATDRSEWPKSAKIYNERAHARVFAPSA